MADIVIYTRSMATWRRTAVLVVALAAPGAAHAQTGNFCVRDFQPGAVCTANDVRVQALNLITILETCNAGVPNSAVATFEIFISAVGAPDRYDIGLFVALDGGSARDGNSCLHDFLEPPLTTTPAYGDSNGDGIPDLTGGPWWNSDLDGCGDIASNTQLFKATLVLRVTCVDTNNNGFIDASVCTSWDNNSVSDCTGLPDAFPGTNAKCGCERVETGIPFEIASPSPPPSPPFPPDPTPTPVPALPIGGLIGLAALLAGAGTWLLRARRP